jgi:hypothetical protein
MSSCVAWASDVMLFQPENKKYSATVFAGASCDVKVHPRLRKETENRQWSLRKQKLSQRLKIRHRTAKSRDPVKPRGPFYTCKHARTYIPTCFSYIPAKIDGGCYLDVDSMTYQASCQANET